MNKKSWITKENVIQDISSKEHFDIDKKFANDITSKINIETFKKYSYLHYTLVYKILKSKLETLEKDEKPAYVDSLILNYSDLMDTKLLKRFIKIAKVCLKFIIEFLFGGLSFTGILSILNLIVLDSGVTKNFIIFALCLLAVSTIFYIFVFIFEGNTKWKMYQMIFQQLKNEISQ